MLAYQEASFQGRSLHCTLLEFDVLYTLMSRQYDCDTADVALNRNHFINYNVVYGGITLLLMTQYILFVFMWKK